MLITGIRIKGAKPTPNQLSVLIHKLSKGMKRAGFVTEFTPKNATCIHISLGGRAFAIDTDKRGYNYRVNRCTFSTVPKSKHRYARTAGTSAKAR
jgi:hypothetical protein